MDKWTIGQMDMPQKDFFILSLKTKAQIQAPEKMFDVGKSPTHKMHLLP